MCSVKQAKQGDLLRRATALGPPAMAKVQLARQDEFRGSGQRSVGCRMLYVINDQEFHSAFGRLQLEPELFLHGHEHGRT